MKNTNQEYNESQSPIELYIEDLGNVNGGASSVDPALTFSLLEDLLPPWPIVPVPLPKRRPTTLALGEEGFSPIL